jgi:hypothetical protein
MEAIVLGVRVEYRMQKRMNRKFSVRVSVHIVTAFAFL